jgi:hypothetical protein
MELLYYEDIQINDKENLGDYLVDRDEAVEF